MPVISINVGPKRVHLTAYCPDDELGLLACDYVLARAAELLDGTSEAELRRCLIERDPAIADLFAKLDAGWTLPKMGEFTVDPSNAPVEARIIRHLLRERIEQCAGRPVAEFAPAVAGPIIAPDRSPDALSAERAKRVGMPSSPAGTPQAEDSGVRACRHTSGCCGNKDGSADSERRGHENKEV